MHDLKHVKVQMHVCSRCKLPDQVITSDHINAEHLKIHTKQCLNKFNSVGKLMKMVENDDNEIPRLLSQCNHLNLDSMIDDIKRLAAVRFMWEGKIMVKILSKL